VATGAEEAVAAFAAGVVVAAVPEAWVVAAAPGLAVVAPAPLPAGALGVVPAPVLGPAVTEFAVEEFAAVLFVGPPAPTDFLSVSMICLSRPDGEGRAGTKPCLCVTESLALLMILFEPFELFELFTSW
jgi:hypothetical protein